MTITLELKPEEIAVLSGYAQGKTTNMEAVLHDLVAHLPAALPSINLGFTEPQNKAALLMQEWLAEKDTLTEAELDQNDRDFDDFKANLNALRAEEGRPVAFR